MTILRICTVLVLLGFAAPAALVWQTHPAQAEAGEAEAGEAEDATEDPTDEEVRARQAQQTPAAAPALAPAQGPDFTDQVNGLTVTHVNHSLLHTLMTPRD